MFSFSRRKATLTTEDRRISRRIRQDMKTLSRYYRRHPEAAISPEGNCAECIALMPLPELQQKPEKGGRVIWNENLSSSASKIW